MSKTPLATEDYTTAQQSPRGAAPLNMLVLHHGATSSFDQIVAMMVTGSRQVSAHAVVKDKRIGGVVVEQLRAWSLSDEYWDSRAFTVECANESMNGWTISAASQESLAQLCANWATRFGFPIIRTGDPKTWTLLGHREVYTIWGGSYATACPGAMNLDWIAARANQIINGNNPPTQEDDMKYAYIFTDKATGGGEKFAIISPDLLADGYRVMDRAEATTFSATYGQSPTATMTGAQFDAALAEAKALRAAYLVAAGQVPVGSVTVSSDPKLLAAVQETTAAVKAAPASLLDQEAKRLGS